MFQVGSHTFLDVILHKKDEKVQVKDLERDMWHKN